MGDDQRIAIHEKEPSLIFAVCCGKGEVLANGFAVLDGKPLVHVGPAEIALVVRTAESHLQQNGIGLTGWADDGSLMIHGWLIAPSVPLENHHDLVTIINNNSEAYLFSMYHLTNWRRFHIFSYHYENQYLQDSFNFAPV